MANWREGVFRRKNKPHPPRITQAQLKFAGLNLDFSIAKARTKLGYEPRVLFEIARSAFVPPPKVTSAVVRFVPRAAPLPCDRTALERVTEAAFGQRRKMLRQSLRSLGRDPAPLLAAAGIDPTARAEDIPVAGFAALARAAAAR